MDNVSELRLNIPDTNKPRVVVIGGGFGGANTIKKLDDRLFQVVLFDKSNYNSFWPLLYQVATAGLQPDAIATPLRREFSDRKDFHFRALEVKRVDPAGKFVETDAGSIHYDYLVIATGSRSNFFGNELIRKYSFGLKSIPDALNFRSQLMQAFERADMTQDPAERARLLTFVLVGGGPTGVETAGAIAELRKHVLCKDYPHLDLGQMKIYLIESNDRVLAAMSHMASVKARSYLEHLGVIVMTSAFVDKYDGTTIHLRSGEMIESYNVVWSAGVTGNVLDGMKPEWGERAHYIVDQYCRVIGAEGIFAIGDISVQKSEKWPQGLPGQAQPAIQMGHYVGKYLTAVVRGKGVAPFKFFDKGALATVGRGKALADLRGNIRLGGRIAWYIWLFVHITGLMSFRSKLLVFTNWIWNYFTYDKGNRLIIRPFVRPDEPE
ncbi:MAG: NAD(P)/FAD-dependent oxidoreductase, partial [Bacteroidetes bacterium]|nr:NAD(P)/FAD-dependent oxidoreductase [Bacteroidota bacterium]